MQNDFISDDSELFFVLWNALMHSNVGKNFVVYCYFSSDNNRVTGQYTDQVEQHHAYIKETVDTVFPSNIRVLEVTMAHDRLFYLDFQFKCEPKNIKKSVVQFQQTSLGYK